MKVSMLARKGITPETVSLIDRLVKLIPPVARKRAMGDVTITLFAGKGRVAENVLGWGRDGVKLGMDELLTGVVHINDISKRRKPKAEEKDTRLIEVIHEIMKPHIKSDTSPHTTGLPHANMTAQSVYNTLLQQGWTKETLPTVRTISNILQRNNYTSRKAVRSVKKGDKNIKVRGYL